MVEENKNKRRRYSLVMNEDIFAEIEAVANELDTSVVEIIKRFLRLGLLMYKFQDDPNTTVQIIRNDEPPKEFRII